MNGIIEEFDEVTGLGAVRAGDGSRFAFHCTRIADGTRTIEEGLRVTFDVVAGHHGRWEAAAVTAGG